MKLILAQVNWNWLFYIFSECVLMSSTFLNRMAGLNDMNWIFRHDFDGFLLGKLRKIVENCEKSMKISRKCPIKIHLMKADQSVWQFPSIRMQQIAVKEYLEFNVESHESWISGILRFIDIKRIQNIDNV